MRPVSFNDFSGGMTNNFVDCSLSESEAMDNFFVTENKKAAPRSGSYRDNEVAFEIPNTSKRINALMPFEGTLLKAASREIYFTQSSSWMQPTAGGGNPAFQLGDSSSIVSWSTWNKHLIATNSENTETKPIVIFNDDSGVTRLLTAGMPKYPVNTGTEDADIDVVSLGVGANTYGFAVLYKYSYVRDGDVLFEVRGAPSFLTIINSDGNLGVSGVRPISNGTSDNYDLTPLDPVTQVGLSLEVYVTAANGTTFYRVIDYPLNPDGNVGTPPGFPGFIVGPGSPTTGIALYTTDGSADNDAPPKAKFVHSIENFTYYGNLNEDGETLTNVVRQSKENEPWAVPGSFNIQVDDEVTGISSVRGTPLIFGKRSVYRVDGFYSDDGSGAPVAVKISDRIGCVSGQSCVQTIDIVYFAGTDGFYKTDGYRVAKISHQLDETYKSIVSITSNALQVCGTFEPEQQRIWWTANPDNDIDNTKIFAADTRFDREDGGHPFTVVTGPVLDSEGETLPTQWTATSVAYMDGYIYRSTLLGYTFRHDYEAFNDESLAETISASVTFVSGSTTATGSFAALNISVGDLIVSTSLTPGTVVASKTNTTLELSAPAIGSATETSTIYCWRQQVIQYDLKGGVTSFGNDTARKWVPRVAIFAENIANLTCRPSIDNDRNENYRGVQEIYVKSHSEWGDSYWGDPTLWSSQTRIIEQIRRLPAGTLRCLYKQLRLQNLYANISSSDFRGAITSVTTLSGTKRALTLAGTQVWPVASPGYTISVQLPSGSMTAYFDILSQPQSNTITVDDTAGVLTGLLDRPWVMKGYARGDVMKLLAYVFYVEDQTPSFKPFQGSQGGLNAPNV